MMIFLILVSILSDMELEGEEKSHIAEMYYNLGLKYSADGKWAEAEESYKKSIASTPTFAAAHHNLGVVYFKQGELEKAIDAYKQSIALSPKFFSP